MPWFLFDMFTQHLNGCFKTSILMLHLGFERNDTWRSFNSVVYHLGSRPRLRDSRHTIIYKIISFGKYTWDIIKFSTYDWPSQALAYIFKLFFFFNSILGGNSGIPVMVCSTYFESYCVQTGQGFCNKPKICKFFTGPTIESGVTTSLCMLQLPKLKN